MRAACAVAVLVAALVHSPASAAEPGALRVEAPGRELSPEVRSFCWPNEGGPSLCHDGPFVPDPRRYATVAPGEALRFTFPHDAAPRVVRLQVWRPVGDADVRRRPHGPTVTEHLLPAMRTTTWQPALPPGRYVLSIGGFWDDRSAAWVVGLDVPAPQRAFLLPAGAGALGFVSGAGSAVLLIRRRRRRD